MASIPLDRLPVLVRARGESMAVAESEWRGGHALLPGSFHPIHEGHWGLARVAENILGMPVAFELSVVNVDKAELSVGEVERRLTQFAGRADVWVTRAPRFLDKAALFPGAVFVVGADTALRLVEPRYYGNDPVQPTAALASVRRHGCRFLVAGRVDPAGKFVTLDDVPIVAAFRDLFIPIASEFFRSDTSSTALRGRSTSQL